MDTPVAYLFHFLLQFLFIYAFLRFELIKLFLIIYIIAHIFLRQDKDTRVLVGSRYDAGFILRVEKFNIAHRNGKHFIKLVKSKRLMYCNSIYSCFDNAGVERTYIMLEIIIHDIVNRYESRNITSSLTREIRPYSPVVFNATGAAYSLVDITGSGVICCQSKKPVIEDII